MNLAVGLRGRGNKLYLLFFSRLPLLKAKPFHFLG